MKLIVFIILLSSSIYSQDLRLVKIDSITNIKGSNLDSANNINIKRKKRTIATGGNTESIFYNVSALEDQKNRKLLKARYNEYLLYKNGHTTDLTVLFYYDQNMLFYIKVTFIVKNTESNPIVFNYDAEASKPISSEIDKILGFELKEWIDEKNKEYFQNSTY